MIAWMIYALLFSLSAAGAAGALEHVLLPRRRTTRWLWAGAMLISAAWPLVARGVLPVPAGDATAASSVLLPAVRIVAAGAKQLAWLGGAQRFVVGAWALLTIALAARLLASLRFAAALRRRATPAMLDGIPVLLTEVAGPALVGLRRPMVIFPRALLALEPTLRRDALAHELEHRQAHDTRLLFAARLLVVALPWNVALWWMERRLRAAVEIDCDARVLRAGVDANRYGRLLLLVASANRLPRTALALAPHPSTLERRIVAMQHPFSSPSVRAALASLALLVVTVIVGCSAHVTDSSGIGSARRADIANAPMMFEFQVDEPARQLEQTWFIRYPDELKAEPVAGQVLAQFVVDTTGRVLRETFKVLRSTNPLFTRSVAEVLPEMRFSPARAHGRAVKQLVQQPFDFPLPPR